MDIIFLILKILWVVLQIAFFIVLFILFLLLVILFANLKYQFKTNTVDYDEKKCLDFDLKATYLFSSIKVFANKKDDKIKILIKIFGYSIYKNVLYNSLADNIIYKNKQNEGVGSDEQKNEENENLEKSVAEEETSTKQEDSQVDTVEKEKTEYRTKDNSENIREDVADTDCELSEDQETVQKDVQADKKSVNKKIKKSKHNKDENSTGRKEKSFIDTLKNKEFVLKAFDALIKFLKTLKPDKFIVRLKLGFKDPSLTGKVMGGLYTLGGVTGLDIQCVGEFDHEIPPDIFMYMKGKVSIFKVIRPFLFVGILFINFKIKNKFSRQKGE